MINNDRATESKTEKKETGDIFSKFVDPKNTVQFKELYNAHFRRCYSSKETKESKEPTDLKETKGPFKTLLWTWNHPWGIGDLVHNRDFATHYREVLAEEKNIDIQSFCIVSANRLEQAKLLLKDKVDLEDVYFFNDDNETFDPVRASKSKYIIWTSEHHVGADVSSSEENLFKGSLHRSRNRSALQSYIRDFNNIVNISRHNLEEADINFAFKAADVKHCYFQSISELVGSKRPSFFTDFYDDPSSIAIYDSVTTGVGPEQRGMEFFEKIIENVSKIHRESSEETKEPKIIRRNAIASAKARFLAEDPPEFLTKLIGEEKDEKARLEKAVTYFRENTIAFGHLQEKAYFERFVVSAIGVSEKPSVVIFTNKNFLDAVRENTLSPDFIKLLEEEGVGSIRLSDTEVKVISTRPENKKQIQLINFSGMSEKDKEKLISISDVIAGSGDSSYSHVFSLGTVGAFPFFQSRPWKLDFFSGMLNDIRQNCPTLTTLEKYIRISIAFETGLEYLRNPEQMEFKVSMMMQTKVSNKQFLDFVKEHHLNIEAEFKQYCAYAYKKHNLIHEQDAILFRALTSSILINGTPEEIDQLLTVIPTWDMGSSNFILFAAEKNNLPLLEKLYEKNKKLFVELITKPNLMVNESSLHLMLRQGNLEILKLILNDKELPKESITDILKTTAQGNPDQIQKALKAIPLESLNIRDSEGETFLHHVIGFKRRDVRNKAIEVLGQLLREEKKREGIINWNIPDEKGNTPLLLLAQETNWPAMQLLLPKADSDHKNKAIRTILELMIGRYDARVSVEQIKKISIWEEEEKIAINWNAPDEEGNTLLLLTAKKGNWDAMQLLLDKEPNPAKREGAIMILFQSLMKAGKDDLIYNIINENPKLINIHDKNTFTLLHHAAMSGNTAVIGQLLKWEKNNKTDTVINWNERSSVGTTPLTFTIYRSHLGAFSLMLSKEMDEEKKVIAIREFFSFPMMNLDNITAEAISKIDFQVLSAESISNFLQEAAEVGRLDLSKQVISNISRYVVKDRKALDALVNAFPGIVDLQDNHGETLLQHAMRDETKERKEEIKREPAVSGYSPTLFDKKSIEPEVIVFLKQLREIQNELKLDDSNPFLQWLTRVTKTIEDLQNPLSLEKIKIAINELKELKKNSKLPFFQLEKLHVVLEEVKSFVSAKSRYQGPGSGPT